MMDFQETFLSLILGTGQNLSGTRAGTIDSEDFFSEKIRGRTLFFD